MQLTSRVQRVFINCPHCMRVQWVEYCLDDNVWFPIPAFCCDVMRYADSPEWNAQLDKDIKKALM